MSWIYQIIIKHVFYKYRNYNLVFSSKKSLSFGQQCLFKNSLIAYIGHFDEAWKEQLYVWVVELPKVFWAEICRFYSLNLDWRLKSEWEHLLQWLLKVMLIWVIHVNDVEYLSTCRFLGFESVLLNQSFCGWSSEIWI